MFFGQILAKTIFSQLKNVRNSIWVLVQFKKYVKYLFWPRFGQKTSKFQLRSFFTDMIWARQGTKPLSTTSSQLPSNANKFLKHQFTLNYHRTVLPSHLSIPLDFTSTQDSNVIFLGRSKRRWWWRDCFFTKNSLCWGL